MPLYIKIVTVGLEEGDPIPFFQNVLMMAQPTPPDPAILTPPPFEPPPIVDQSWLHFPLELP